MLQTTIEHCFMGKKGNLDREKNGDFVHASCDLDLLVAEDESSSVGSVDYGKRSAGKTLEMFGKIERFCLGRRRLHLFANEEAKREG